MGGGGDPRVPLPLYETLLGVSAHLDVLKNAQNNEAVSEQTPKCSQSILYW